MDLGTKHTVGMLKSLRYIAEGILAILAIVTVPLLPRRALVAVARGLGRVAFRCAGRLRRIAVANLDAAYGDTLNNEQKQRIALSAFRMYARFFLDLFWFSFRAESRVRRFFRFDASFEPYWKTKPAIVLTCHLGNWEMLGQALAIRGEPALSVAAPMKNPFVQFLLGLSRRATSRPVVGKQGVVRYLLRALRKDERVALLLDQNTMPRVGGEFTPFFGLPVPVSKTAAALAARTDAPIIFVYCIGEEDGGYRAFARPPLTENEAIERYGDVTSAVTRLAEDAVRAHPGEWGWMYKRWKYIPRGKPRDGYPFYALEIEPGNL
jgi:KDO2-lipid IV(A) lauroyltransferase